jgi:APA family basic amino acid/polyamine antiporter
MAGSTLVARDAIAGVFGGNAGTIVTIGSLLILLSSLNVNFLATPRVAFALSRDRLAPEWFSRVSTRGTPVVAMLFVASIILILAVSGAFEILIRFMMLVAISVDLVVLMGFIKLRIDKPDMDRPLRVPGYPWLPGITILLYVLVLATIVVTQPALALGGGAMIGTLIIAGWLTSRSAGRGRS